MGKARRHRFSQKRRAHGDDEFLWLISLSDLMILLFIFFVVMFAFTQSKLKQRDIERLLASLRNEKVPPTPVEVIENNLKQWVKTKKLSKEIEIRKEDDALLIEIKDKLLFGSGSATPHQAGVDVMKLLAQTVNTVPEPYKIGIEGHTDDSPIHTTTISDNWDLSAKRAWGVLHAMELSPQIEKRSVIMGYGQMKPIVPNRDKNGNPIPKNQTMNRRVTIRIF